MGLSIKNEEVERLVRKLSQETGRGITEVIRIALEEKYEKVRRSRRGTGVFEEILSISERCGSLPPLDSRTPEEILGYGEHGAL